MACGSGWPGEINSFDFKPPKGLSLVNAWRVLSEVSENEGRGVYSGTKYLDGYRQFVVKPPNTQECKICVRCHPGDVEHLAGILPEYVSMRLRELAAQGAESERA